MSRAAANWVGYVTIVRREVRRVMRIWPQTLLPPVITMTLYFIIFGTLIGRRIGEMGGHDYMLYIAPGLIIMSVLTNAYANVSSSFFGAKFGKHVEELLVSPLPNSLILMGYVTGGVLRALIIGALVTVVAMFFTPLHIEHPVLMVVVVLLTAVVFSLAGFINGVYATKFDDISIIPTFVLTPLTYLGGVHGGLAARAVPRPVADEPDPVHGQRGPLRDARRRRRRHRHGLLHDPRLPGGAVRHRPVAAREGPRPPHVGAPPSGSAAGANRLAHTPKARFPGDAVNTSLYAPGAASCRPRPRETGLLRVRQLVGVTMPWHQDRSRGSGAMRREQSLR